MDAPKGPLALFLNMEVMTLVVTVLVVCAAISLVVFIAKSIKKGKS